MTVLPLYGEMAADSALHLCFCNCTIIVSVYLFPLRKHAYSNTCTLKNEHFQIKNSDIFHTSAQNIDCGDSNEYPLSLF